MPFGLTLAFGFYLLGSMLAPQTAAGQEVVAIVEEAPPQSGLMAMDYLEAGRRVQLGPDETLVLGYLASCIRETIDGGIVVVGPERSDVKGGAVSRSKVDCAGGSMQLSSEQAQQSGVMISRSLGPPQINSLQPVFSLPSEGVFRLIRQDKLSDDIQISVSGRLVVDLADQKILLEPGALYKAEIGDKELKFSVSKSATAEKGDLLSRLLVF